MTYMDNLNPYANSRASLDCLGPLRSTAFRQESGGAEHLRSNIAARELIS